MTCRSNWVCPANDIWMNDRSGPRTLCTLLIWTQCTSTLSLRNSFASPSVRGNIGSETKSIILADGGKKKLRCRAIRHHAPKGSENSWMLRKREGERFTKIALATGPDRRWRKRKDTVREETAAEGTVTCWGYTIVGRQPVTGMVDRGGSPGWWPYMGVTPTIGWLGAAGGWSRSISSSLHYH